MINKKHILFLAISLFITGLIYIVLRSSNGSTSGSNQDAPDTSPAAHTAIIAQNLDTPWSLVFLPDNRLIFTEKLGRVRLIEASGELKSEPIAVIENVSEIGEGGLLGLDIHPDFTNNHFVYLYYTYKDTDSKLWNRVVRMTLKDDTLVDEYLVLDHIPAANNHNGGRIKFGPDAYLYIATGDSSQAALAQDINSLAGKILRLSDLGQVPSDNPFNNPVWTYGHRNPQGLAWDDQGRLWSTEHGRSGARSGFDEINLIIKGRNYGWPLIQGNQASRGLEMPYLHSGEDTTWAPSGMTYYDNQLLFAGLRGQSLYQLPLVQEAKQLNIYMNNTYGRLRDVVVGPNEFIYISTSNRDGRGNPDSADDMIIKINSKLLK